jgi:NAD-dependent SIR2 family protein deacetylase
MDCPYCQEQVKETHGQSFCVNPDCVAYGETLESLKANY